MYRITKVLNHNTLLALSDKDQREQLFIGKGIGFGRHPSEYIEIEEQVMRYEIKSQNGEANPRKLINNVDPISLALSNQIIIAAKEEFPTMDTNIIVPLADHIAFATKRLQQGMEISNPLTNEIKTLFSKEYEIAIKARTLINHQVGIVFNDDELGYIAMHIHSALEQESMSQTMQTAQIVQECMILLEKNCNQVVDISSLSYSRMVTHIKYMVARIIKGEKLKISVNEYMEKESPKAYKVAGELCEKVKEKMKLQIESQEQGYLALHITRIFDTLE